MIWFAPWVQFVKTRVVIDQEGRYVLLEGVLDGRPFNVAALYCPNVNQGSFLEELSPALFTEPQAPGLWAGDFNSVHSTTMDGSAPPIPGTQGITSVPRL